MEVVEHGDLFFPATEALGRCLQSLDLFPQLQGLKRLRINLRCLASGIHGSMTFGFGCGCWELDRTSTPSVDVKCCARAYFCSIHFRKASLSMSIESKPRFFSIESATFEMDKSLEKAKIAAYLASPSERD